MKLGLENYNHLFVNEFLVFCSFYPKEKKNTETLHIVYIAWNCIKFSLFLYKKLSTSKLMHIMIFWTKLHMIH